MHKNSAAILQNLLQFSIYSLIYRVHINYWNIFQNHIFTNTEQKFRSLYGPGVDSASNRNEYQEY
jgi:hypothetical protein